MSNAIKIGGSGAIKVENIKSRYCNKNSSVNVTLSKDYKAIVVFSGLWNISSDTFARGKLDGSYIPLVAKMHNNYGEALAVYYKVQVATNVKANSKVSIFNGDTSGTTEDMTYSIIGLY